MALVTWLDRVLYRTPFEGGSARRYAQLARPAFGDLDDRLLDALPALATARYLLDLGFGPGAFATRAAARHPHLTVVAVDPSRDFARPHDGLAVVRGAGEQLPLADGSIDVAVCLSSIRHVEDRARTLRELRRVVRRGGSLLIVELDPQASGARIAAHADQLRSTLLRHAFGPLIVKTAPRADVIEKLARDAGWTVASRRDDAVQPVYVIDLV